MLTRNRKSTLVPDLSELFAPVEPFGSIGIAVSGGPDSMALMVLAATWAKTQTPSKRLFVYCVDHGLRPAAHEETSFVAKEAEKLSIPARVLKWEGEKPQTGIMAAARLARYRLIGEAMLADRAEVLLTAHHMNDQAETILMRMAHGSGLAGLGGMDMFSQVEGINICRPLLSVSPLVLAGVVADAGIVAVSDPSNADANYERVRWRSMLPGLTDMGLGAERFSLFGKRVRRADEALDVLAGAAFSQLANIDDLGVVKIGLGGLELQPDELKVRLMQSALRIAGGNQKPFLLAPVEELVAQVAMDQAFAKKTLFGCVIELRANNIVFAREVARVPSKPSFLMPGEAMVWDKRFEIENPSGSEKVEISSGLSLTREVVRSLIGEDREMPMAHVHAAPVIRDDAGGVLAIGCMVIEGETKLKISQITDH